MKNCTLGICIYNESLAPSATFNVGHVGFYLEDVQGQRRHFDFGMVGTHKTEKTDENAPLSKAFKTAGAYAIPATALALYSIFGAVTGTALNPQSPYVGLYAGTATGFAYGLALGLGVGITKEASADMVKKPDREIKIPVSAEQYDHLASYVQRHKLTFYSAGLKNCVTYVEKMMRKCGIETPGCFSAAVTPPSHFANRIESLHTQPGSSPA